MEFFAAGGFQQLFSDLLEPHVPEISMDEPNNHIEEYSENLQRNMQLFEKTLDHHQSVDYHEKYSNMESFLPTNEFLPNPSKSVTHDLQKSLDFLLPQSDTEPEKEDLETYTELYASAFISSEVAEWEEKFLDNYIEIPELVEFLPEKTPLCTDVCELFLHESTQNLQLCRKTVSESDSAAYKAQDDKSFPCTFGDCQKIYAKPAHLKAHLRRHLGEKPYVCTWTNCTWRFSRSDELARHRRSHSGIKPYKCIYCTKGFARSDHLTKHRKVHERRMLAASRDGKTVDGQLPPSVFTVRPGRKRKNQSYL